MNFQLYGESASINIKFLYLYAPKFFRTRTLRFTDNWLTIGQHFLVNPGRYSYFARFQGPCQIPTEIADNAGRKNTFAEERRPRKHGILHTRKALAMANTRPCKMESATEWGRNDLFRTCFPHITQGVGIQSINVNIAPRPMYLFTGPGKKET